MTVEKIIREFDRERENELSVEIKTEWIAQFEKKLFAEILEPRGYEPFSGLSQSSPLISELCAPEEYGEIYSLYIAMKLDYMNGEIARFNNSASLFNRMYKEMADFINRGERVKKKTEIKAGNAYV